MTHRLFIVTLFAFFLVGCEKEELKDDYYVKYSVSSSTIYYGGKLDVTTSSASGDQLFNVNQRVKWETTIGPVKKGFVTSLKIKKQGWDGIATENHLSINAKIELSKNGSPFYLVKNDDSSVPRATCEISHQIN